MFDITRRNVSGCGLTGIINILGVRIDGSAVTHSMANMRERGNGLGAGFAAYGIYPQYSDCFAVHIMFDSETAIEPTESLIKSSFHLDCAEQIPNGAVKFEEKPPAFKRYFVKVLQRHKQMPGTTDEDYVLTQVMKINAEIDGAFVISSGKNMGVFKGVGFPEQISEFFRLEQYEAHCWIGHTRFPTNTPGWWGGAHPFTILDWAVVHNGEISSYGTNRRYLEQFGYHCTMQTDTEVMAYLFDLLLRKHRLPLEYAVRVLAAEFWRNIDILAEDERALLRTLRIVYAGALVNGPFAVIVGHSGGMIGLSDRVKLRPLVAARDGDWLYISSEEAGIREICPDPEQVWRPGAGEPVEAKLQEGVVSGA